MGRFPRSLSYIISRIVIGAALIVFAFYFKQAHAQTAGDAAVYWGEVGKTGGGTPYYGQGNSVTRFQRGPFGNPTLPISQQMRSPTLTAAAGGPIASATRNVPVRGAAGGVVAIAERIKLTPAVIAPAVRTLARGYPLLLAASAAYQLYQDDKITYDEEQQDWLKEEPGPMTGRCDLRTGPVEPVSIPQCVALTEVDHQNSYPPHIRSKYSDYRMHTPCVPNSVCYIEATYSNPAQGVVETHTVGSGVFGPGEGNKRKATDAEMDEAWRNGNGAAPEAVDPGNLSAAQLIADKNIPVNLSNAPAEVTIPTPTVQSQPTTTTTTKTNPDGSTTTTTREQSTVSTVTNVTERTQTYIQQRIEITVIERTIIRNNEGEVVEQTETTPPVIEKPDEPEDEEEEGDGDPEEDEEEEEPKLGAFKGKGGSAKTFGESLADFRSRAAAAPMLQGITAIAAGVPTGGSCPTASFAALGRNFTIDAHCPLLDQFKSLISAVFMLGWSLYCVVLFLRA